MLAPGCKSKHATLLPETIVVDSIALFHMLHSSCISNKPTSFFPQISFISVPKLCLIWIRVVKNKESPRGWLRPAQSSQILLEIPFEDPRRGSFVLSKHTETIRGYFRNERMVTTIQRLLSD